MFRYLLLSLLFVFPISAHAQATQAPQGIKLDALSTLSIGGCQFKDNVDDIHVLCRLKNGGVVQPDVRLGVGFQNTGNTQEVVGDGEYYDYIYYFNDVKTFQKNETKDIEVTINKKDLPLDNGSYKVTFEVFNTKSLNIAFNTLGTINVSNSANKASIILNSCAVFIDGDKAYKINNGIDIKKEETAHIKCNYTNKNSTSVVPQIIVRERGYFGDEIKKITYNPFKLASGIAELDVIVPSKDLAPQSYTMTLNLYENGVQISKNINFRIVIAGESATLQNISITDNTDKVVKGNIFWSGSADNFLGARFRAESRESFQTIVIYGKDKNGNVCTETSNYPLDIKKPIINFALNKFNSCEGINIVASINDINNKPLDLYKLDITSSSTVKVVDTKIETATSTDCCSSQKSKYYPIVIAMALGVLVLIILIVYFIYKIRKNKKISSTLVVILLLGLSGGVYSSVKASCTYINPSYECYDYVGCFDVPAFCISNPYNAQETCTLQANNTCSSSINNSVPANTNNVNTTVTATGDTYNMQVPEGSFTISYVVTVGKIGSDLNGNYTVGSPANFEIRSKSVTCTNGGSLKNDIVAASNYNTVNSAPVAATFDQTTITTPTLGTAGASKVNLKFNWDYANGNQAAVGNQVVAANGYFDLANFLADCYGYCW